jgi:hypothetical protein
MSIPLRAALQAASLAYIARVYIVILSSLPPKMRAKRRDHAVASPRN